VDGAELLVARQHLAGFTVHLLKDREVADEVEQVGGAPMAAARASKESLAMRSWLA
jgi:hypothetical protein